MAIELRGGKKAEATKPFARFKLRDNPFVSAPVANFAASDPRLRKIFSREAQKAAIERIEARWVGARLFPERLRVGFLWAQSTDLTDKGMGKSAVLFHIIDRLNDGWGQAYSRTGRWWPSTSMPARTGTRSAGSSASMRCADWRTSASSMRLFACSGTRSYQPSSTKR